MKIAIQGQRASFHDIATHQYFGNDSTIVSCDTFSETFAQLDAGSVDFAIVAIENSLYGPINPVYDLLLERKPWVCGEIYLRIEHCLIGLEGSELDKINEVHSQVMAIGQCEDWLQQNIPHAKHIEEHDTTASVAMVKKWNDPYKVAIASQQAAKLHNMKILATNIEDHHQNFTRFFVLQKHSISTDDTDKTSIIMRTSADTKAGALYRALGVFANRNINIFSLQSRPIVGKAWHYMFYIDFGIGNNSPDFSEIISELTEQGCEIDILGSYKNGRV